MKTPEEGASEASPTALRKALQELGSFKNCWHLSIWIVLCPLQIMAAAGFGGKWHWTIIAQSVMLGVAIGILLATWKTRRGVDVILDAHFPGWDNPLSGKEKCGQCGIVMPEGKTRCRFCGWESPAREAANLKS